MPMRKRLARKEVDELKINKYADKLSF